MSYSGLRLWQKALILILAPLLLEVFLLTAVKFSEMRLEKAYEAERESAQHLVIGYKVLRISFNSIADVFNYRASHKDYALLRCRRSLKRMQDLREQLFKELESFSISPLNKVTLDIQGLLEEALSESGSDLSLSQLHSLPKISSLVSQAVQASEETQARLEEYHSRSIRAVQEKKNELNLLIITSLISSAVLAFALASLFHKDTAQQIDGLMINIARFGRREPLLPAVPSNNELGELDRVFHSIAANIQTLTERERAVLANARDLILVIDAELKIQLVSQSSFSILNRQSSTLVGLPAAEISAEFSDQLTALRNGGSGIFEITGLKSSPDSQPAELEVSAAWSEREQCFYCVAHDIGERKALERLKQNFIAMVSHDLRSPIGSAQVALQLLRDDSSCCQLTPEGSALIGRMLQNNTRLLSLINDLLDLEKLDYGLVSLNYELIAFDELIDEALSPIRELATSRHIELVIEESERLIFCDARRLSQSIQNLVSNAIKVSQTGQSVAITLHSGTREEISIKDCGPGIAEEFIPHLFERYSQSERDPELARQGSGLGLTIALKMVQLHDGIIEVESTPGKGSVFKIIIPTSPAHAVPDVGAKSIKLV